MQSPDNTAVYLFENRPPLVQLAGSGCNLNASPTCSFGLSRLNGISLKLVYGPFMPCDLVGICHVRAFNTNNFWCDANEFSEENVVTVQKLLKTF